MLLAVFGLSVGEHRFQLRRYSPDHRVLDAGALLLMQHKTIRAGMDVATRVGPDRILDSEAGGHLRDAQTLGAEITRRSVLLNTE